MAKVGKKNYRKTPWRGFQSDRKISYHVKIGVVALSFLVVLIAMGKVLNWLGEVNRPLSPIEEVDRLSRWNGQTPINLAVKADKHYLLRFIPQQQSAYLLTIPDDSYLNLPFGFSNWPTRSVYQLGKIEAKPMGAKLLKSGLNLTFALPVDGYLFLEEQNLTKLLDSLKQNPLTLLTLMDESQTDLTGRELWQLMWDLRSIRSDRFQKEDLAQMEVTDWKLTAAGERILIYNIPELDQFIQEQLADDRVKEESLSIGIFNTTDHAGIGERAARMITNLGGRVIFVGNASGNLSKTVVTGEGSYTQNRLTEFFAPGCLVTSWNQQTDCSAENLSPSRADITVYLGEDYFIRYNTR